MKLLFDENLSRRLVELVQDLLPGAVHVTQVGLSFGTPDREIWDYAKRNGFAIITADRDFVMMANTLGHPPKVIILENCNYPYDCRRSANQHQRDLRFRVCSQ